jgi:hypothetical protein
MTRSQHLALLGFAFVAAWAAFGVGTALLCVAGAALFAAAGAVLDGDLDLGELQDRVRGDGTGAPRASRVR